MVTVVRANSLCVVIYVNDHRPAHVHVFGESEAKINLLEPGGSPDLIWADAMRRSDVRRVLRLVAEQQALPLKHGERMHDRVDQGPDRRRPSARPSRTTA
ncbi:DUF4160 domain-containing protein [Rhodopila sp.]|uniref:DUF4160 domain-containing protein n=1 Tax=Rhodopila sp. TaxID=2480087 RepID=UPI003D131E9B